MEEIIIRSEVKPQFERWLPGIPARAFRATHRPTAVSSLFIETPQSVFTLVEAWPKDVQNAAIAVVFTKDQVKTMESEVLAYVHSHQRRVTVYPAPGADAAKRVMKAHSLKAADKLIASANIVGDRLFVWSCEPRQYSCLLSELPGLAALSPEARQEFTISETGSRISWPAADLDFDLDAIRARCDEKFRRERDQKVRKEAAGYAKAIRALREQTGLKQAGIPGLSEREVRRIETGSQTPRLASLKKLAAAHKMTVENYLRELAKMAAGAS